MSLLKYPTTFITLLSFLLCYRCPVYADSIIFLPDSNKSQKKASKDDFSDGEVDSDLRLFDIQKKGFKTKNENGFKALPEKNPITKDSIELPMDMQQEDLPIEYNNMFDTSLFQTNTESKDLKPAKNVAIMQTKQNNSTIEITNGSTFIAISNKRDPQKIHIKNKVFPWVAHPKDSNKKIAFVAINYHLKPQNIKLSDDFSIKIVQGDYKQEKITIKDTRKTKPDKASRERIAKELAEANEIYRTYTKTRYWNKPFILPLNSVITSPFGSARVFNNEIKSFHGGTDFRAAIGTPIHASNDGIVVIAKDRFLAGKSVVIDHGEGIFSMYYHCSDIKVELGEMVKRGQVVALSGDTGKVSGAHLHFGMLVNGVQINPIDFINKVNMLF